MSWFGRSWRDSSNKTLRRLRLSAQCSLGLVRASPRIHSSRARQPPPDRAIKGSSQHQHEHKHEVTVQNDERNRQLADGPESDSRFMDPESNLDEDESPFARTA